MARRRGWYVDLFRSVYPDRWFEEGDALSVKRTQAEVDFTERALGLKPGSRVLERVGAALWPGGCFFIDFINCDWVARLYQARDWRPRRQTSRRGLAG